MTRGLSSEWDSEDSGAYQDKLEGLPRAATLREQAALFTADCYNCVGTGVANSVICRRCGGSGTEPGT